MHSPEPPYDARTIANYILARLRQSGRQVSLLALMKLLYFAHGIHLARYGGALLKQNFEAWENGPVLRAVWESLKEAADRDGIDPDVWATRFDPVLGRRVPVESVVDRDAMQLVDFVLEEFGSHSAFRLVEMTHEHGSPWHQVWICKYSNFGMTIGNDAIRTWFSQVSPGH